MKESFEYQQHKVDMHQIVKSTIHKLLHQASPFLRNYPKKDVFIWVPFYFMEYLIVTGEPDEKVYALGYRVLPGYENKVVIAHLKAPERTAGEREQLIAYVDL